MSYRILFVDDQPEVLHGTRRMLFSIENDWDLEFASSGEEALERLSQKSFDIIVTDMKMPAMDGGTLLAEVARKYPGMIRMVMSGYAEEEMVLKAVENSHQFLAKPVHTDHLVDVLNRGLALLDLLHDERLADIVAGLDSIPSLPSAYMELMKVLNSPGSSIQDVGRIIAKDVAMSAKIMQMVNSAFFGLPVDVKDPVHATNLLGAEVIRALVVSVHVFKTFESRGSKRFSIEQFTKHSLSVGALAKAIAIREGQPQNLVDDAFVSGMLHDVGKLILVSNFPDYYDRSTEYAEAEGLTYVCGEEVIYNATHAELGAYLLGLWGFRDNIVEAVAFHHRPGNCKGTTFSPLTAVHIADAMENEYGAPGGHAMATIHMDYLLKLGLLDKLEDWRQVCLDTQHALVQHDE